MKYLGLLGAIGAAALVTMPAGPAVSASVADFYKDKRIKIIIGWPPGGGYDRYGRVLGRHIFRHIPGKPKIIVQNMPGAGSLTATNYLYNKAPQDGTVIGIVSRGIPVAPLMGTIDKKNARFDPLKFLWLGSLNNEVSTVVAYKDSPIKSIQDVMKREMIVGGMTPTSDPVLFAYVLNNVLGTKFRVNTLCPGGLLGNWTRNILSEEQYAERVAEAETEFPLRRPVLPADVAEAAIWLIEGARVMTGEIIRIDAGKHLA